LRVSRCPARRHHHTLTDRAPRLQVIEDPEHSPRDNPVERIRTALDRRIANTAPAAITDRIRRAQEFFPPHQRP
jgi:transposase